MPLIHVYYPTGSLADSARDALAEELTAVGLECERLPATPFVRSTTWVYFHEVPPGRVYHGGRPGGTRVTTIELNAFEGGLDAAAKRALVERYTRAVRTHAGIPGGDTAPVYVVLRDVPAGNWGVFGGFVTLEDLRNPDPEAEPI